MATFNATSIRVLSAINDTNWETASIQRVVSEELGLELSAPLTFKDESEIYWLLTALETRCDVVIDDADVTPDNFQSVAHIANLIGSKQLRAAA